MKYIKAKNETHSNDGDDGGGGGDKSTHTQKTTEYKRKPIETANMCVITTPAIFTHRVRCDYG